MRKVIVAIGKFFYRNKITLTGFLSLGLLIAIIVLKMVKPEIFDAYEITNPQLFAAIGFLFSISSTALFGFGLESEKRYSERLKDVNERKQIEKELKEKIKNEVAQNKWVTNVAKEIERDLVTGLMKRLESQAIDGVKNNYVSLTKIFPELNLEYLKQEINDEPTFNKLLEEIDKIANTYGLFERKETIEAGRRITKEVNLLLEEMKGD